MDLALTDEQDAVVSLAAQILEGELTGERRRAVEDGDSGVDAALWRTMADAGLLGLCVPEADGGAGMGAVEAALLVRELGRATALVPLQPTLVASVFLAEQATKSDPSTGELLTGVAGGDRSIALALADEPRAPLRRPATTHDRDGLHGTKTAVGFAPTADLLLVTAADGVYAVPLDAAGVAVEPQVLQHRGRAARITFSGAAAQRVAGPDGVGRLVDLATLGVCAVVAGACDASLALTAQYAGQRHQFGRPIGSFQAVETRLADAHIAANGVRLTTLSAATLLDERDPSATDAVAIAKYWAANAADDVGHASLHVHGGISIDRDYPVHRYFLWLKTLEHELGGMTEQLATLGASIAHDRSSPEAPR